MAGEGDEDPARGEGAPARRDRGFSMYPLNSSRNLAARKSSTIRASAERVTVIICEVPSGDSGSRVRRVEPTARIQAWGGLITAENSRIPNIPRLEILETKQYKRGKKHY